MQGDASVEGVLFPASGDGRSSTATGRAIAADAARAVDPALAARIEAVGDWRAGYVEAFRALTEAAATSPDAAVSLARAGLASVHARLVVRRGADEVTLARAASLPAGPPLATTTLRGAGTPVRELALPHRGELLRGDALRTRLAGWVRDGVVEPGCATAIEDVLAHPEWLAVPGRTVVLLGAGAEMGPLEPLSAWGADVLAVDLPAVTPRIRDLAARGAGTVRLPGDGADLLIALPELRDWIAAETAGAPVALAGHVYADGAAHVRLVAAADALAAGLPGDAAVVALATPTDAYLVPPRVVADARDRWATRPRRALQAPLRALSRGRLLRPAYDHDVHGAGGRVWGLADGLVAQQGPNYALAKRIQRWRAIVTEADGGRASLNVAPATATRSVLRNRALAAAYAGAHHFGVEVFDPATTRVLMAALLVRDLHRPAGSATRDGGGHPEDLLSAAAAHGGLWRVAYEPRSALGIAAVLGAPASLLRRP